MVLLENGSFYRARVLTPSNNHDILVWIIKSIKFLFHFFSVFATNITIFETIFYRYFCWTMELLIRLICDSFISGQKLATIFHFMPSSFHLAMFGATMNRDPMGRWMHPLLNLWNRKFQKHLHRLKWCKNDKYFLSFYYFEHSSIFVGV